MQQIRRYAFTVRMVRRRVHNVFITYVQEVIYILAKIHTKNSRHTIQSPLQIGNCLIPMKDRKQKQNAWRLKDTHICAHVHRQNVPALLHLRDTFCDSWMLHRDSHGIEFDIRQQTSPTTDPVSSQKPMK
jgi:hypothetical protein